MLEVNHVCKDYRDGARTITAVTIDHLVVNAGEQLAIVGPSGSGKTTLLHLISGLLTPTSGEIQFDSLPISTMPEIWRDAWRAKTVGYVFQKLNLLPSLNILDNLLVAMSFASVIPHKEQRQRAVELLGVVGLADRLASRTHQLSMGEQQRVAIARAVVNKPRLILADEPTASLDYDNSMVALTLLKRLAVETGSILLVSTHDRQIISLFDRVCQLGRAEGMVKDCATSCCLA